MKTSFLSLMVLFNISLFAQRDVIPLVNPSFEGTPAAGKYTDNFNLGGWFDCAPYYFRGQTPPDVQQGSSEFFEVTTMAQEGKTYLGMVVRQNETWELVSQRLVFPLEKGNCYAFDINLARSETYFSALLNQGKTEKRASQ